MATLRKIHPFWSELERQRKVQTAGKDRLLVGPAVAIGIFEN